MRTAAIAGLVIVAMSMVAATGTGAHHGWSGYDSANLLKLEGVIKEAGYEHPHGYIRLEVPGKVWNVVLAPPSRMENRGLQRAALKPGVKAVVEGYPARDDPVEMRAERITVDGKTTELR
jgi:hypothetical protein